MDYLLKINEHIKYDWNEIIYFFNEFLIYSNNGLTK